MAEKRPATFRLWEVLLLILLALVLMVLSTWTDFAQFVPGLHDTFGFDPIDPWFPQPSVKYLPLVLGGEHLWTFIWWLLLCLFGWAAIKRRSGPLAWGVLVGLTAASVVMVGFCSAAALRAHYDAVGIGYPVPMYTQKASPFGQSIVAGPAFVLDFLFWAAVLSAAACVVTFILHGVKRRMRRRDAAAA